MAVGYLAVFKKLILSYFCNVPESRNIKFHDAYFVLFSDQNSASWLMKGKYTC